MLTSIKAVIRNGRIETAEPLDLPDGTELLISVPGATSDEEEDGWDNSPEGIAAWLKWLDSLEPTNNSEKEEKEAEVWLKKCEMIATEKLHTKVDEMFQ